MTHDLYRDYPYGEGHTVMGDLKLITQVASPQLGNSRDLLVLLPQGYHESDQRYPVIYMHDGQNLFDARTSFAGEWQVDESLALLAAHGYQAIVVGIPNMGPERFAEYSPYRDRRVGGGRGRQYLAWLVRTVKPLIDTLFRTLPARRHTLIAGSSMGGLISLYAYFAHPTVFGVCAALSPALWVARPTLFAAIRRLPFSPGKIYLDAGGAEGATMLNDARAMAALLSEKGYQVPTSLRYEEDAPAGHNEAAWGARFRLALPWLLQDMLEPG